MKNRAAYVISNTFVLFFLMMRPAAAGTWAKVLGGNAADDVSCARPTSDGGCVLGGYTSGNGGDIWIARLGADGELVWEKSYGTGQFEAVQKIIPTSDAGFLVLGETRDAPFTSHICCLKIDASGDLIWQRTYSGDEDEFPSAAVEFVGHGYLIGGNTKSAGTGLSDVLILYVDTQGNLIWQRTFGGPEMDYVSSLYLTGDGGWGFVGSTQSWGSGRYDIWCLRVTPQGTTQWQKTLGGVEMESSADAVRTADGGLAIVGYCESWGPGDTNLWCVRLDAQGNIRWQKAYGGQRQQDAKSIVELPRGDLVITGWTNSFGQGSLDLWLLRLDRNGNPTSQRTYGGPGIDGERCVGSYPSADGGLLVVGSTDGLLDSTDNAILLKTSASGEIDPDCGQLSSQTAAAVIGTAAAAVPTNAAPRVSNLVAAAGRCASRRYDVYVHDVCGSSDATDLTGSWSRVRAGGRRVRGRFTCTNAGSTDAIGFQIQVFVSADGSTGGNARLVATRDVNTLRPGASVTVRVRSNKSATDHFVVAVIDPTGQVGESDEANNIVSAGF